LIDGGAISPPRPGSSCIALLAAMPRSIEIAQILENEMKNHPRGFTPDHSAQAEVSTGALCLKRGYPMKMPRNMAAIGDSLPTDEARVLRHPAMIISRQAQLRVADFRSRPCTKSAKSQRRA
jgi:hypothetical protein